MYAGFEALTAVVMKSYIIWYIKACSPLKASRLYPAFFLGLLLSPEDGGYMFRRSVS
jgi:hypothetical protein